MINSGGVIPSEVWGDSFSWEERGRCSIILEVLTTFFAWFPLFDVMTDYAVLITFFFFSIEEKSHLEIVTELDALSNALVSM